MDIERSKELVELYVSKNDKEAIAEIFSSTKDFVFSYVYKRVGKREVAKDIVSETFITFIEIAERYTGESKIDTFLIGIARNKILQFIDNAKSSNEVNIVDDYIFVEDSSDTITEEDMLNNSDNKKLVNAIMNQLKENYRDVLEERFIKGKSIKDCAEDLDISEENVRVITHRALKKAQKIAESIEQNHE